MNLETIKKLKANGKISEKFITLYGISGSLPDRDDYFKLSPQQQKQIWTRRMELEYGDDWRSLFTNLPYFAKETSIHDWKNEGF